MFEHISYEVLHVFNLMFILHNIYRYVIGLKMNRPLILAFYLLLLISTILRVIEFGFWIARTFTDKLYETPIFYAGSSALAASMGVELVLILTMHRLSLSLQLLVGKINQRELQKGEYCGLVVIIAFSSIILCYSLYYWI